MEDLDEIGRKKTSPAARIAAPVALLVAALICISLISSSSNEDSPAPGAQQTQQQGAGNGGGKKKETPKTYEVVPGDSLTGIADEFGISIKRIQRLNDLGELEAIIPGQELKLR